MFGHVLTYYYTTPFLKQIKSLGNMALQANVFDYLLTMLKSPYFSGDRVSFNSQSAIDILRLILFVSLPSASGQCVQMCHSHTSLPLCVDLQ